MSPRGRGRRRPRAARQQRAVMAVTTTRIRARDEPPPREQGGQWRRVLQKIVSSPSTAITAMSVKCAEFFDSAFNTLSFDKVYFHRVSVWSSSRSTNAQAPSISAVYLDKENHPTGVTYKDYAAQADRRACVAFTVPAHMSGPYWEDKFFLSLTGDTSYIVEVDATFV